jgi:hypothetical protein
MEPNAGTTEVEEKQPWTTPVLKKMDIEETAFGGVLTNDADGLS